VVDAINSGQFDLIVLNYANPDMVGHTGVLSAAIKAVEIVDDGLGQIMNAIDAAGGALLVIADHGNAEQMLDPITGEAHTAHTTNPVPCLLHCKDCGSLKLRDGGRLADVAPTLLDLMKVEPPLAMTGVSLLREAGDRDVVVASGAHIERSTAARKGNAFLASRENEIATNTQI
jgi:2,3-bisphosphoglycerate-independent phosphoglycerate mutase